MAETPIKPAGQVPTPEQKLKQRRRSVALAWCIGGLVLLFYVITIVKMGPAIFNRPL